MGIPNESRRALLLTLLGVGILVAALVAVGRLTPTDDRASAVDSTAKQTSETPSGSGSDVPSADVRSDSGGQIEPKQSRQPKEKKSPKRRPKADGGQAAADAGAAGLRDLVEGALGEEPAGPADPATFRIASLNVLGNSHTRPGGNMCCRWAGARARMGGTVGAIRGVGVDVIGFQEFEAMQNGAFLGMTGGWETYPGMRFGRNPVRNSIGWNTTVFEMVRASTMQIPYFHGKPVRVPYVLLKHRETGRLAWFINVHNPASTRCNAQRWRTIATRKEIALMNRLQRPSGGQAGIPTFLMGDFNEKAEAFCSVTRGANAQAANGGTASPCRSPANRIDWIFGSTTGVSFSGYGEVGRGRISDHPLIHASVTLSGDAPAME
ncbi:hypothetical protein K8W59_00115 [Nocardioides rotundus]|uniref:hypothetical protein n=1 Tax=Nocardioides rotundus TaxID=1774216 RepID=UPI001CC140DB|nr:hypothetical protein [Nocardioides rotundus]UAL30009.1 hypothetical protein K8W59_00115 [Nocardioides rotundus]